MVLGYYGRPKANHDFRRSDPSVGTSVVETAKLATEQGLSVSCFSYNLELFDPSDAKLTKTQLLNKLEGLHGHPNCPAHLKDHIEDVFAALDKGVRYCIRRPTPALFQEFLSRGIPLIVSVYSAVLRDQRQRVPRHLANHSILLSGFEGDRVFYFDPNFTEEQSVSFERLLFAMYSRPLANMGAYMVAPPARIPYGCDSAACRIRKAGPPRAQGEGCLAALAQVSCAPCHLRPCIGAECSREGRKRRGNSLRGAG